MRVTSALFAAALVRRANGAGAFAVLARKGAEEAGAVLVRVDRPDGTSELYVPAPQAVYDEASPGERRFTRRFPAPRPTADIDRTIAREADLDLDIWVIAIEDREGRSFLDDLVVE